ncbi:Protein of unknown function [Pricia antarctica]|uniref:DUF3822 domain-containing protein n=1 Tax=Pricia antarctica TaxID=641691 RepID=A0A1G7FUE3_9FLAO|nr:DUF3822 family protein [Pricia antarctica]SDE79514.1 Protein of unknown function [Pricia antarctica]
MENHTKLSIQVSLNGLSFCILDTPANTVIQTENVVFVKQLTPYALLKRVKQLFQQHKIDQGQFSEVVAVHRNNLFGFVPQPFFDPDELANYVKFNTKILVNDHIAYDEIDAFGLVNVYVPFVNINNYIYGLFGAFTFKHHGTVMVESLLNRHKLLGNQTIQLPEGQRRLGEQSKAHGKEPICYVYVFEGQMDVTIIAQNKLLLYNNFSFVTKEDFLYYLLFTLEQLQLDTASVTVKLFGDIDEDDDIYELCYQYIRNVAIFSPYAVDHSLTSPHEESIDFTVLNAL